MKHRYTKQMKQMKQKKQKKGVFSAFFAIFAVAIFAASCSSSPRDSGEVLTLRMRSETQLELGNREADRGNYEAALILLNESRRLAIIADDPSLLVRTGLSRGNVLLSLGYIDDAFVQWENAAFEAERIPNRELLAVSRIHIARGRLFSQENAARSVLDEVRREMAAITSDQRYIAFSWLVLGLAHRGLGNFAEAEAAVRNSLNIHERYRHLEQAAYDWFVIASIRSLAGNLDGAIQALYSAIDLDRRTENSWGLASDWRAMGDVQRRAGNHEAARQAYLRSAAIFRALGHEDTAAALEEMAGIRL